MKHLHLLIPDLFLPPDIAADACAGLRLPALEKLLARGNMSAAPGMALEGRLCVAFGARAVAPVRAAADGLYAGAGYWMCADPVSLQLQRAQMMLLPDVMLSQEQADVLCAALNEHFGEGGPHFMAPHPQRWYVKLEAEQQLSATPLSRVAWRDAKFYQPHGEDALHWQRITTEMQMVLHAHPLNQARVARGELPVGSLWLWGGGKAEPLQRPYDAVGGDSALGAAFARVADIPRVASLQEMLGHEGSLGLWLCDGLSRALQCGDLYAWREAVQQVERDCAQPVLQALQAGRLRRLTLEVLGEEGVRRFELGRGDVWKLWRRARSLARYAV
ncbi:MAG TPA: hypothetical protein VK149_11245 [Sideroxyarcus sp.]|nr:hypothetical protein [Sideroxyarcus sp.]